MSDIEQVGQRGTWTTGVGRLGGGAHRSQGPPQGWHLVLVSIPQKSRRNKGRQGRRRVKRACDEEYILNIARVF